MSVGDALVSFALSDATGQTRRTLELTAGGRAVIVFYRGGWCPLLQRHASYLPTGPGARTSAPYSARLVAISPETPDASLSTQEKAELTYTVPSDTGVEAPPPRSDSTSSPPRTASWRSASSASTSAPRARTATPYWGTERRPRPRRAARPTSTPITPAAGRSTRHRPRRFPDAPQTRQGPFPTRCRTNRDYHPRALLRF